MNKTFSIAVIAALALALTVATFAGTTQSVQAAKLPKVIICHEGFDEETNSTSFTTLNINAHAVAKHIANHGDVLGPCPEVTE